ncbi:Mu transposase domain-containing protein [Streptomyces edwardsiae]|uniref:Mu transposase domain-containing protein n=1 Tax=Streptomyces edwardsiae TaxID=3075527 RepID=UPI00374E0164
MEPFETGRWLTLRVNRFSHISVRGNAYSVPVRFIVRRPTGPHTHHTACWLVTSPEQARARRGRPGIVAGRSCRAPLATPPRRRRSPW